MDFVQLITKNTKYIAAVVIFLAGVAMLFLMSPKIMVTDEKTFKPILVYSKNFAGQLQTDWLRETVMNPFFLVVPFLVALSVLVFEEAKKSYLVSIDTALLDIDPIELAEEDLPSPQTMLRDEAQRYTLEATRRGFLITKTTQGEPIVLYLDLSSNYRDYRESRIVGVNREHVENIGYHFRVLKAQIADKLTYNDAISILASHLGLSTSKIMAALGKAREQAEEREEEAEVKA